MLLKYPIKGLDGAEITEAKIRGRVKVADMMHVAQEAKHPSSEGPCLVARMTGLTIEEVERLDLVDYNALYSEIGPGKSEGAASF